MAEEPEHPLDGPIAELGWMQTQLASCNRAWGYEDFAQQLAVIVEELEKERERTR